MNRIVFVVKNKGFQKIKGKKIKCDGDNTWKVVLK